MRHQARKPNSVYHDRIRPHFVLFVSCLLVLAGCAYLGVPKPETFNEGAAYVHSGVNGVVAATTRSLNSGAIHSTDAEYVRKLAVDTRTYLGTAEAAFAAGDIASAEGRLKLAKGILEQLNAYLLAKGIKP